MELRNYQAEALNKIKEMDKGSKGIIEIATGGGKTIIFSKLVAENKGRSLIVIDQEELLQQTVDKLSYFTNEKVGRVKGVLDEVGERITCATRQSLTHPKSDRMERILEHGKIDYLIIDECHIALEQQKKIIEGIGAKYVIGFSATPYSNGIEKVYDDILFKKDILSLVKEGYLVSPRALVCESNVSLDDIKMTLGDFNQKELNERIDIEDRNKFIVKKWIEFASDRIATIVFCSSIENAKNVRDEFKKEGISCESIDSDLDTKERADILRRFENGEIKVLCNVNILTKGVDITRVDCIVEATPTRSLMKYIQQIGRALRLHGEGKKDALILDITDNCKKHSLINCNTAFGLKDGEDINDMEERLEHEAEIEKIARLEREEEERVRKLKEEELIMREIQLFNESIFNIRENSIYDWYFNKIKNVEVAILKANKEIEFYIVAGDKYTSYKRTQKEGYVYDLEIISESDSLKELQEEVEDMAVEIEKSGVYINPRCLWKQKNNLTEKQRQACKSKEVKTVWEVTKYFSRSNSFFALKDII